VKSTVRNWFAARAVFGDFPVALM